MELVAALLTRLLATANAAALFSIQPLPSTALSARLKSSTKLLLGTTVMENVCELDVPPPGAGVNTVTVAVPVAAMSVAGIAACSCAADTNVVDRSVPFQRTTQSVIKPLPLTVRVNAGPPTWADVGLMLAIAGAGLPEGGIGSVMVDPPVKPGTVRGTPSLFPLKTKTSVASRSLSAVAALPEK